MSANRVKRGGEHQQHAGARADRIGVAQDQARHGDHAGDEQIDTEQEMPTGGEALRKLGCKMPRLRRALR